MAEKMVHIFSEDSAIINLDIRGSITILCWFYASDLNDETIFLEHKDTKISVFVHCKILHKRTQTQTANPWKEPLQKKVGDLLACLQWDVY